MNWRRQRWLPAVAVTGWTSPFEHITLRSTFKLFNRFSRFFFRSSFHQLSSVQLKWIDRTFCTIKFCVWFWIDRTYFSPKRIIMIYLRCEYFRGAYQRWFIISFEPFWLIPRKHEMFSIIIICSARHLSFKRAVIVWRAILHPRPHAPLFLRPSFCALLYVSFCVHCSLNAIRFIRFVSPLSAFDYRVCQSFIKELSIRKWMAPLALSHSLTRSLHI